MGNTVKGAFTVRFLRTGDQIFIVKNVVKFDQNGTESGAALFQAIDPTNGTLSADWKTDIYNQPTLKVGLSSAVGNPVTITNIKWTYRGVELAFNASTATSGNYVGWQLSTDGNLLKRRQTVTAISVLSTMPQVLRWCLTKSSDSRLAIYATMCVIFIKERKMYSYRRQELTVIP